MLKTLVSFADATAAANNPTDGTFISFGDGLSVFIYGLAIVFFALVALIFITVVYPKISTALIRTEPGKSSGKQKTKIAMANSVKDAQPKENITAPQTSDDTALIAVITAAVAASLGTSSNGVVIRSISRHRQSLPPWGKSGRTEQIY